DPVERLAERQASAGRGRRLHSHERRVEVEVRKEKKLHRPQQGSWDQVTGARRVSVRADRGRSRTPPVPAPRTHRGTGGGQTSTAGRTTPGRESSLRGGRRERARRPAHPRRDRGARGPEASPWISADAPDRPRQWE